MNTTATLRVVRELSDIATSEYTLVFEAMTSVGRLHEICVSRSELVRPQVILHHLAGRGWVDAHDRKKARQQIDDALAQNNWPKVRVTSRTGWSDPAHFVLPHRTIGSQEGAVIFAKGAAHAPAHVHHLSNLGAWRQGLRAPCLASSYLTFTSALAMAGAVLEPLEQGEGAIFQLTGKSSTGKTLALRVAQSAMGSADISGVLTHDVTDRGLEEHLAAANDSLLCIDELARLPGTRSSRRERIRRLPHILASGIGRARSSTVESDNLDRKTYRLLGLSTGESPLESYGEREEGERVRYPDIPVPPVGDNGIFDRFADDQDAAALAAQVEKTIRAHHGVAYEAFIERLVRDRAGATADARKHVKIFLVKAAPDPTSWERRFAMKFAVVYAAAVLASAWKILPFSPAHARKCILRLHRKARVEARTAEETRDALLQLLRKNAETDRFPLLKKGEPFPADDRAWGFRRKQGETMRLAVMPAKLKAEIRPERHVTAVLQMLADQGVLLTEREDRFEIQLAIDGMASKRPMFYAFDMSKLP